MPRIAASNRVIAPEQQNLFIQSNNFSSGSWGLINCTIGASAAIGPDGITGSASAILEDNILSQKLLYQFNTGIQINSLVTCSCYMKKGTRNFGYFVRRDVTGTFPGIAWFDLNNGAIGTYSTNIIVGTPRMISVGSGWYRCCATFYNTGILWSFGATNADGADAYTGSSSTQAIFIYGINMNKGNAIPTYKDTTSSVFNNGNPRSNV